MSATTEDVGNVLAEVIDPLNGKKLGKAVVKDSDIRIDNDKLSITVALGYPLYNENPELEQNIKTALQALPLTLQRLDFTSKIRAHAVQQGLRPLPHVKNIIAVASGKGGVGKSTTAVNIALALASQGGKVGLLDADIYGPSVPIMLGLSGRPKSLDNKSMEPLEGHGIQANSIGFLIDADAPAIWRGPMVSQALEQLLNQTNWKDLDYLIVDMPPGTGDIALTLSQKVPLTGAIIVTTPQDLALADARKGLGMFDKVKVPILGLVENMSVHVCSQCGHAEAIFGKDGGKNMAAEYNVPWLGALPLSIDIRTQTDSGMPTVLADPTSEAARLYQQVANKMAAQLAGMPTDTSALRPTVVARRS